MNAKVKSSCGFAFHAGQLPVIGPSGQRRLRRARVLVSGTGRVGSSAVTGLHAAGIAVDCFDRQTIEAEQIGPFILARKSDIGTPKAIVLARALSQRRVGIVRGTHDDVECVPLARIRQASLVISCANNIQARLSAEHKAIQAKIPILQVAAFDGREQLGGMITFWHPANRDLACYGCLAGGDEPSSDGRDGLLTPVTAVLGNMAAHFATLLLAGYRDRDLMAHNVFIFDLERMLVERLEVRRRLGCAICGGA